jgi:hypothetical protein
MPAPDADADARMAAQLQATFDAEPAVAAPDAEVDTNFAAHMQAGAYTRPLFSST